MLAPPVSAICPVDSCVWYINANSTCNFVLEVTSRKTTRKTTGCEILLYVAFTPSQASLHQPGGILPLNFTNVAHFCFNPVQFYDSIISFEFQSGGKKIFRISFCLYLQNVITLIIRSCAFIKYVTKFFKQLQATSMS